MFEFISDLGSVGIFLLLIIFILFVLAIKKVMSIIKNIIIIAIASILFPIVMNRLGFSIPIDGDSILSFLFIGVGLYFIYLIGKSTYTLLKIVEKFGKGITSPLKTMKRRKKEKLEKKIKEHIEKEEKNEKVTEKEYKKESIISPKIITKPKKEKIYYKDYIEIKEPKKKQKFIEPLPEIKPKKKE
ncbi:MAG: hypothetical protein QXD48_00735 [Candidatus Aenigmatarchaeota archaeon]